MNKTRAAIKDFTAHLTIYAFLLNLTAFAVYAALGRASLTFTVCAVFSVLYWAYWLLRLTVKMKSRQVYRAMEYSAGLFVFFLAVTAVLCVATERLYFDGIYTPRILAPQILAAVFICISQIVYAHIEGVDETLNLTAEYSVQPVREIRGYNNKIIAALIFAALVLAAAVYLFWDGALVYGFLERIGLAVLNFIRGLFGSGPIREEIPIETVAEPPPNDFEEIYAGETSDFFRILGWIIRHYYMLLALAGFALLGCSIFAWLKGFKFKRRGIVYDNGDISEAVKPELRERLGRRLKRGSMPADPVRKAFFKKIRKYGDLVKKSDTANEMAEKISLKEDIGSLAEAYQSARYGGK